MRQYRLTFQILEQWDKGHPFSHCYGLWGGSWASPGISSGVEAVRGGAVGAGVPVPDARAGTGSRRWLKTLTLACNVKNEGKQLGATS